VRATIAVMPADATPVAFLGAAMLCGVSDPVALLMADQAFPHGPLAAVAKIGVLVGSGIAAVLGAGILLARPERGTPVEATSPAAETSPA
jgi:NhaA family Na+:H+ antiporter